MPRALLLINAGEKETTGRHSYVQRFSFPFPFYDRKSVLIYINVVMYYVPSRFAVRSHRWAKRRIAKLFKRARFRSTDVLNFALIFVF